MSVPPVHEPPAKPPTQAELDRLNGKAPSEPVRASEPPPEPVVAAVPTDLVISTAGRRITAVLPAGWVSLPIPDEPGPHCAHLEHPETGAEMLVFCGVTIDVKPGQLAAIIAHRKKEIHEGYEVTPRRSLPAGYFYALGDVRGELLVVRVGPKPADLITVEGGWDASHEAKNLSADIEAFAKSLKKGK